MKPSEQIRALAAEHGINAERGPVDDWVDKISELSGNSGEPSDEIEQLLINMLHAKKISQVCSQELLLAYMDEKDAVDV